ncbi:hypothetical protein JXB37_00865 [candidate division WOR-3 bacterium]|nr:hypothetical protein [candidate division WOR-3 bacterium]
MKRNVAIAAGLLLAAGLAAAAPGNTRTVTVRRPGLLGWLFGRRQVVEVRHAPRRVVRRNRCEVRHDRGRHLGWTVGQHKGWNRQGRQARGRSGKGQRREHSEHSERRGGGRGRNR